MRTKMESINTLLQTAVEGTQVSTPLSSKVNLHHTIDFRVNLVTQHPRIRPRRNPRTPPYGDGAFIRGDLFFFWNPATEITTQFGLKLLDHSV